MAQGFFKHIPNIEYDFKSDGKFFEAKDLFRKVSTWSYLQEAVAGYSYLLIKHKNLLNMFGLGLWLRHLSRTVRIVNAGRIAMTFSKSSNGTTT